MQPELLCSCQLVYRKPVRGTTQVPKDSWYKQEESNNFTQSKESSI
jgi:hypothetical protein